MSDSNSDASQSQTQESQDNRIVAATDSVNLGASRSTIGDVSINITDRGAIDSSFKFANSASDSSFKFADSTMREATKAITKSQEAGAKLANAVTDSALKFGDSTVSQAFGFAENMQAGAADEVAASGARSDAITKTAMQSVGDAYSASGRAVQNAYKDTAATLATAYENSKAGEQKVMVAAALAVVALVAVKSFGK